MLLLGVGMVSPKLQFNGFLFNGKSAHKQPVRIVLTPFNIILTVQGKSAISWPYSDIRWAAETSPFHIERDIKFPVESLEILVVDDLDFYENCRRIAPGDFSRTALKNYFKWKIFSAGILSLLLVFYGAFKFFPNYFIDQVVDKIPVEWEETLGDTVLTTFPVEKNPDPKVIALLTDILRLLKQSKGEEAPYNLKVYILPTEKINALALPGGNIIIFQGLLKIAESPEELAGVLAHEAQHIFLRHSTRGILRNLASGLLLAMVLGDANTVMEIAINIAGQFNTLGFSRKMETEADIKGVEMMLDAKINPQGMFSIFKKLMKEELKLEGNKKNTSTSKYFYNIFSYMSTHPSVKSRLNNLEVLIANNSEKLWIPLYPNLNWNEIKPIDR
jgi:beta-barrel assembly-enhancing protease